MHKKISIKTILILLLPILVSAQDPHLSQFYAAPLFTNPALAGASRKIRFATSVRNQYTALNNNYRTAVFGIDGFVPNANSGLGLLATYDIAGDGFLTTTSFNAAYSYSFDINRKWAISAGLMAGMLQKQFDFSKFIFEDQLDPVRGVARPTSEANNPPLEQRIIPNFSTGGIIFSDAFFAGAAIHNLFEPNQSFYYVTADSAALRLPRRYTLHAGANIYLTESRYDENRMVLSPNILFMQQRTFSQINAGFYLKQKALTVGTWFRQTSANADAVIFLLGLRFPAFRVGYTYDLVVSKARSATVGSHELSLIVELKTPKRQGIRNKKVLKCPEF
ncbi:MAG: PorP/SprF family type IX secretion system membrane protein [Bacteroidia bacterium]